MPPIDIVTVVFAGELPLLDLQAHSFARFLDPALVDRIRVIVNDPAEEARCRAHVETVTRARLGPLGDRLVVHAATQPAEAGPSGWTAQQAAKLAIAAAVSASHYLILDAKHHLLRPLLPEDLFRVGKVRMPVSHSVSRMRAWMANSRAFFGLDMPPRLRMPPSAPPFCVRSDVARALVGEIEVRSGLSLDAFFAAHGNEMTEFTLYAAFVAAQGRTRVLTSPTGVRQPTMRRHSPSIEDIPAFAERLRGPEVWALAIHRRRFPDLGADTVTRNMIVDIWTERTLFADRAAAEDEMARLIDFYAARRGAPEMENRLAMVTAAASTPLPDPKPSLWRRLAPHLRLFVTTWAIGFVLALLFIV